MPLGTISAVTAISTIVTTISSTRLFMHVRSFRYSPVSHDLLYMLDVLLAFYIYTGTYHCSISVLNYIFYHQNCICIYLKDVFQVFLIHLFLSSCWILSNICLLFYWKQILLRISFQEYYRFHNTYLDWW